jgi:SAM-dependent methyltransferase
LQHELEQMAGAKMSEAKAERMRHLDPAEREYHTEEHRIRGQDSYLVPLLTPLDIHDNLVFADLGCGSGYINAYLGARRRLQHNIGLELDWNALALAKELNADASSIHWLCASAEFIPLAAESVDVIVCRGVVPLARAEIVIAEIGRILKRGGRAAVLLHRWNFYLRWLSLNPRHWKRTVAAILHFSLGLCFNLTGKQVQLRHNGKRIGQTWQTLARAKQLFRKYGMEVGHASCENEFFVYVHKSADDRNPESRR